MKAWSANNWQYGLGVVWAVIGLLGIVVFAALSFIVPIPKLADLKVSDTVMTGEIEIHRPSKAPAFLRLPTQDGVKQINNVCFIWDCSCDCGASVSRLPLRQGDKVRIWARDEQLWQLTTGPSLILGYQSAVEGERRLSWVTRRVARIVTSSV